jgi:hypothetical protein
LLQLSLDDVILDWHPGPTLRLPLDKYDVKTQIKNEIYNLWKERWSNEPTCRQTKLFVPTPLPQLDKQLLAISRDDMRLFISYYTGHCNLRRHKQIMGIEVPSSSCRGCQMDEETCSGLVDYIIGSVAARNFVAVDLYYSVRYPFPFPFTFNKHSALGIPSIQTFLFIVAGLAFVSLHQHTLQFNFEYM